MFRQKYVGKGFCSVLCSDRNTSGKVSAQCCVQTEIRRERFLLSVVFRQKYAEKGFCSVLCSFRQKYAGKGFCSVLCSFRQKCEEKGFSLKAVLKAGWFPITVLFPRGHISAKYTSNHEKYHQKGSYNKDLTSGSFTVFLLAVTLTKFPIHRAHQLYHSQ